MDDESKVATRLFEAIAMLEAECFGLYKELGGRPEVVKVERELEIRKYQSPPNPILEVYVDAELKSGNSIAWFLDIGWNETQWLINSWITTYTEKGQDDIKEFSVEPTSIYSTFLAQLEQTTSQLVGSIDTIDLAKI